MKKNMINNLFLMLVVVALIPLVFACAGSKNPRQAQMEYSIALDLLNKGDQTRAIAQLLKANQLDPENAKVHNLLGLVYGEKGLLEKAISHLQQAVTINKEYSEAYNNLGAIYLKQNKPDLAIVNCKKAVANITYGTPERAYNNIGYAYELKNNISKAIENYQAALLHNKLFFLSHLNLGKIYFKQKKYKTALKSFKQAEKGCNVCAEPFYRSGLTYLRIKKRTLAKKAFNSCIKLDSVGETGKQCRYYLKLIK